MSAVPPFEAYLASRSPDDPAKVFPCVPSGKEPACPGGHRAATADSAQLQKWAAENPAFNVGLDPHSVGLCVVDIDGAEGENTWTELQIEHGFAPETRTIQTPRGGRHLYFRGELPTSASRLGPHIDTRGAGASYVLIPPSVTPAGVYSILDEREPAELPAWIAARLQAAQRPAKAAPDGIDPDTPANVERARVALRDRAPAIQGQGGDAHTFATAAMLRDLGVSEETALDLMLADWNDRCNPPWEADELAVKVANAFAYAQNEPGAWALQSSSEVFGPAVAELLIDTPPAAEAVGPVAFRDILSRSVPPVDELVGGLVERGTVTFLSAPGGSHKSRVALQWGLCVDSGTPIFGRPVQQATFVYLSYEDHPDEVARRAQAITTTLQLPRDRAGQYWDLTGTDSPLAVVLESGGVELQPMFERLTATLQGTAGHKFIVLDGTYNALRFAGSAKINETSVMAGIALLQRLCLDTDSTILALWHPSQAGQERGDASGWSVAWHNAPRARLSLSPVKDREDAFMLRVEKRNHGAKGQPITLHWSGGALLPWSEASEDDQGAAMLAAVVRVATMAAEAGAPLTMQRNLVKWQLDEIEHDTGRRPVQREAKEALALALPRGLLRYLKGTNRQAAGYYPVDAERAAELARQARRERIGEADA